MSENLICKIANDVGVGKYLGCGPKAEISEKDNVAELINKIKTGKEELSEENIVKLAKNPAGLDFLDWETNLRGISLLATHPNCCTKDEVVGWVQNKESGYPRLLSLLIKYLDGKYTMESTHAGKKVLVRVYPPEGPGAPVSITVKGRGEFKVHWTHEGDTGLSTAYGVPPMKYDVPLINIYSILTEDGANPIKPGEEVKFEDLMKAIAYSRHRLALEIMKDQDQLRRFGIGKAEFENYPSSTEYVDIERPVFDRNILFNCLSEVKGG